MRPTMRNAGPRWGFTFMRVADRLLPPPATRLFLRVGSGIALAVMHPQRRYSRDYLRALLGREPRIGEQWRQFHSSADALLVKLRVADRREHRCTLGPASGEFEQLVRSPEPALFGTMHFGRSDLLGFMLGHFQRKVSMVRLKVGNSSDTELLGQLFGNWVSFMWINDPDELLFTLKNTIQCGASVALQCDRPEYSARLVPCEFLGARRLMPFTIYHLSLLFGLPVVHAVGIPLSRDVTQVHASPVFRPDKTAPRAAELERAHVHFQIWLRDLERILHAQPHLWSNFTPLNPVAAAPV